MTSEQLLVITKLLKQVDPVSMWEAEDYECWILDLGIGKEIDIYSNGSQLWFQNGKIHRLDGPAVIYADGTQRWYLNGEELSKAEHAKAVALLKQGTK